MRNALLKIWGFCCVPFMFMCGGMIFGFVMNSVSNSGTYFGLSARFILATLLYVLGMVLLCKMPKRSLIISSAVVCVISLIHYLLLIYRFRFGTIENNSLMTAQKLLSVFITLPNNIVFPVASFLDADSSVVLSIIFSVIEILLPMVYAFSGAFNRIIALFEKSNVNNTSR